MPRTVRFVFWALLACVTTFQSYLLGQDMRIGFRVAIGQQKAAAHRVRKLHGETVVWITPDEVAAIVANLEAFKPIAVIKRLFPGMSRRRRTSDAETNRCAARRAMLAHANTRNRARRNMRAHACHACPNNSPLGLFARSCVPYFSSCWISIRKIC
jgi:hypothetical protein